jgi:hypothetical protein
MRGGLKISVREGMRSNLYGLRVHDEGYTMYTYKAGAFHP